jgi:hypothetical protein
LGKGLASIANGAALKRVNSTLISDIQNLLQTNSSSSGTSSSSSSSSGTSGSSQSASSTPTPATGTGTVALSTGTSLSTLGILPGGTITISAGLNSTTYTSTGTDTVGTLINAINVDLPTNAQVTASLNSAGRLVITSRNDKDSIAVVGSGIDASAIGFGVGNSAFQPTAPAASSSASSSSQGTSSSGTSSSSSGSSGSQSSSTSSSTSSTSSSSKSSTAIPSLLALTEQNLSSAAAVLSDSGVAGSLVNMLT